MAVLIECPNAIKWGERDGDGAGERGVASQLRAKRECINMECAALRHERHDKLVGWMGVLCLTRCSFEDGFHSPQSVLGNHSEDCGM